MNGTRGKEGSMKIGQESKNVYINWNKAAEENAKAGKGQQGRTVFAGNIRGLQPGLMGKQANDNPVLARKAEAVKKAVKIKMDAWAGEQALDNSVEESRQRMAGLEEESAQLLEQKAGYEARIKEYEGNPDLSDEEKAEMTASLKEAADTCQKKVDANTAALSEGRKSLEDVQQEMLKSHKMVDASKYEEKALLAASKDAAYGMMKEGADQVNEKIEKIVEEAKKKKEEEEEEKEKEEARETREAAYAGETSGAKGKVRDDITGKIPDNEEIKRQIQKILDEELLTNEDLMGAAVDALL